MDSILTDSGPSVKSWTQQPGYRCLGAFVANVDGKSKGREIIASFYNFGFFATCIRVYSNQINRQLLMSVWNRGAMEILGFYDLSGDSAKEILCLGNLNWRLPYFQVVLCLKPEKTGLGVPDHSLGRTVYEPRGIVSPGWSNLLWADFVPFLVRSDTIQFCSFIDSSFTASDKSNRTNAEIVVWMTDSRIYWLDGDGNQTRFGLQDRGPITPEQLITRPNIIRITEENIDSLRSRLFDGKLFIALSQ